MDNDRELRIEFRRALDDVLPPAPWLEAAVAEDLRKLRPPRSTSRSVGKSTPRNVALPRPLLQLAAGLLILVLAAAAATAYIELRYHAQQATPAGMSVKAYQAIVSEHLNRLDALNNGTACTTPEPVCPEPGRPVLKALQSFLDDLNQSRPPSQFAMIDAQLRRHLTSDIADYNVVIASFQSRDQTKLDNATYAMHRQYLWIGAIASGIINAHQVSLAEFNDRIRYSVSSISCAECLSLGSVSQVDCFDIQSVACVADVAYARSSVQDDLASIVRLQAPTSLAAQDAFLLNDLVAADTGVLEMGDAQVTGDQAGFHAGRQLYQQALPAVSADSVRILGG